MKTIKFTVPGEPKGKGRPRFVRKTGIAYTPKDTTAYENLVRVKYLETAKGKKFGDEEALAIYVLAEFSIPKSATKSKKMLMTTRQINPTKKPDCDNILKIVCDALNGIAYRDDSQIVTARIDKRYTDGEPQISILLDKINIILDNSDYSIW